MRLPPAGAWVAGVIVAVLAPVVGVLATLSGGLYGPPDPVPRAIAEVIFCPARLLPSLSLEGIGVAVGVFWGGLALVAGWILALLHHSPRGSKLGACE